MHTIHFPNLSRNNLLQKPCHRLCEISIITPQNIFEIEINNIILEKVEGKSKEYRSVDTVINIRCGALNSRIF